MIAEKDPHIANAAQTLYRASADERIRNFCEGREEGEKTLRTLQIEVQQSKEEAQQFKIELQQKDSQLHQKDSQLAAALARIAELEAMKQERP